VKESYYGDSNAELQEVLLTFVKLPKKKILERRTSVNISRSTGIGRGLRMYNVYIKYHVKIHVM